jgi:hypothetical protein
MAQTGSTGLADELETGRRIYNDGVLPSGAPLVGTRPGNEPFLGAAAACIQCHRRSGMGQVEGNILVPPVTGNFLFPKVGEKPLANMDPRVGKQFNQAHDPYTDASFSAAIRQGTNSFGRGMTVLMPRYDLSDAELKGLTVYLRQLSANYSPGVTHTEVRLATVITPDVEPARRQVMIDMLQTIARQKNSSTATPLHGKGRRHMTSAAEMILGTERKWMLDIWELKGAPDTWGEQLNALYRANPVFAIASGLTNSTWQPVHDFCAREQIPCWFPSVEVPANSLSAYAFYFSGGVSLEANVLARHLKDQKKPPRRLVQIYRDDVVGRAAAQSLTQALAGSNVTVSDRVLKSNLPAADALRDVLKNVKRSELLMLWLRPDDVLALNTNKPVSDRSFFSAVLAKGEAAPLPADWRASARLVYPYELPTARTKNLDYFYSWLNIRKIPLIDEPMQSEVFFAFNFLTDTLSDMLNNLHRDYLVERAETMLSKREGIKSEQETRDRYALGRPQDLAKKHGPSTMDESVRIQKATQNNASDKSQGTTLYPHLSLGPEQRLASKGAYIVRFADKIGKALVAESALIVP